MMSFPALIGSDEGNPASVTTIDSRIVRPSFLGSREIVRFGQTISHRPCLVADTRIDNSSRHGIPRTFPFATKLPFGYHCRQLSEANR
jgi:hypothetical protein